MSLNTEMLNNRPVWSRIANGSFNGRDSETLLKDKDLDWTVSKRPLFDGNGNKSTGYGVYRDDTDECLGVVKSQYNVLQNREAFGFLDNLVQDNILQYENVFSTHGGRKLMLVARMPTVDTVHTGDASLRYIVFTTSHDGTAGIRIIPTHVRVACANMLGQVTRIAKKHGNLMQLRHTGNMHDRLNQVHKALSLMDEAFTDFTKNSQILASKKITAQDVYRVLDEVFPIPKESGRGKTIAQNKQNAIKQAFRHESNQMPYMKGTAWQMFNAFTYALDHDSNFISGKGNSLANKVESSMIGNNSEIKEKVFQLAMSI